MIRSAPRRASSATSSDRSTDTDPPTGPRWRPSARSGFRACAHRNYRLLWTGQTVSVTGTWMQSLALAWLILSLTDSAFDLALVGAVQCGPTLVRGLAGALIADRFPKRSILLV